jgi:hypothetical protein
LKHDPVKADLRDALDEISVELARIEGLAGYKADPGKANNFGSV